MSASDAALPASRPHRVGRRIGSAVLTYGVVLLALWFLLDNMRGADEASSAIALITWQQVAVMCVLGVVDLATNLARAGCAAAGDGPRRTGPQHPLARSFLSRG